MGQVPTALKSLHGEIDVRGRVPLRLSGGSQDRPGDARSHRAHGPGASETDRGFSGRSREVKGGGRPARAVVSEEFRGGEAARSGAAKEIRRVVQAGERESRREAAHAGY